MDNLLKQLHNELKNIYFEANNELRVTIKKSLDKVTEYLMVDYIVNFEKDGCKMARAVRDVNWTAAAQQIVKYYKDDKIVILRVRDIYGEVHFTTDPEHWWYL